MKSSGSESEKICEPDVVTQIAHVVHELCQPLTTLQCRLELARILNTPDDYRDAVALGAAECARMSRQVHALRELLSSLAPAGPNDESLEDGTAGQQASDEAKN